MKCKIYWQTYSENWADHFYPGCIHTTVETRNILLLPISVFPLQKIVVTTTHSETILRVCVCQCECVIACGCMWVYVRMCVPHDDFKDLSVIVL